MYELPQLVTRVRTQSLSRLSALLCLTVINTGIFYAEFCYRYQYYFVLPNAYGNSYGGTMLPVCPVNGLLYGLEALDGLDGAEYLLPTDLHVVGDVSKHGRLHKEALLSVPGGATKI